MYRKVHRSHRRRSPYGDRYEPEELPNYDDLRFCKCIGQGHFSHVYKGIYQDDKRVAIKLIERGNEDLIENEVRILQQIRNVAHVVKLYEWRTFPQTVLIFEYINGISIDDFFQTITIRRLRYILSSILSVLANVHKLGIIHRDLTMKNIMISPDYSQVQVIDWGCGCYISHNMNPRAGSRYVRPPEMLLGDSDYGTSGDIWAVGILILYILTNGNIPWQETTTPNTIRRMSQYYPYGAFPDLAHMLQLDMDPDLIDDLNNYPSHSFSSAFSPDLINLHRHSLFNLMGHLLAFNPNDRPTAEEALHHPFFAESSSYHKLV